MTLKTDYFDGATGLHTQMNDVFDAGVAFVTANLASLTTELQSAAAKGVTTFTVNITTTDEPANLRLNGLYLQTYLNGIAHELANQDIYGDEVSLSLNTSQTTETSIDFNFTF